MALKHRIDEIYTAHPFYGSQRIAVQLRREGRVINRKAVQRHMRQMGIAAIGPQPRLSQPNPQEQTDPYLLRHVTAEHPDHVWGIEIVCTQMTKTDVFTAWLRREDVANLHIVIGHHDPVDEQFDELAALLERRVGASCSDALAEVVEGARNGGQFVVVLGLLYQVLLLVGERRVFLVEIPSAAFILAERDDAVEVGVGEPLPLVLHAAPAFAQHLTLRLQLLGQPLTGMGPFESCAEVLGMQQQVAELLPDERIELVRGDEARGTRRLTVCMRWLGFALALPEQT